MNLQYSKIKVFLLLNIGNAVFGFCLPATTNVKSLSSAQLVFTTGTDKC